MPSTLKTGEVVRLNIYREITVMEGIGWGQRFVRIDDISGEYEDIRRGRQYHLFGNDRGIDLFLSKSRALELARGDRFKVHSGEF